MAHHYLNKIGVKSDETCVFNTEEKEKKKRAKYFAKIREKHGFDDRETWNLNYTMATWIYEHLKLYLKLAGQIVDLTYYKFEIPTVTRDENNKPQIIYKEKTEENAIKTACKYLKKYLQNENNTNFDEDIEITLDKDLMACHYYEAAMQIIGKIAPALWW